MLRLCEPVAWFAGSKQSASKHSAAAGGQGPGSCAERQRPGAAGADVLLAPDALAGSVDLRHPEPHDITDDLVRDRLVDGEPDGALGQLEGVEPVAHRVHDP